MSTSGDGAASRALQTNNLRQNGAGNLDSDKTKDIRTNNIIAAKGTLFYFPDAFHFVSCRFSLLVYSRVRCRENQFRTKRYGQDGNIFIIISHISL